MKASVEHIRQQFAFTERRACRLLLVPVSSYRYRPRQNDAGLRERLVALARENHVNHITGLPAVRSDGAVGGRPSRSQLAGGTRNNAGQLTMTLLA